MKKPFVVVVLFVASMLIVGCRTGAGQKSANKPNSDAFPKAFVGVWEADVNDGFYSKWGFKFTSNGEITKLVHMTAGRIVMAEGGSYMKGRDPNTSAMFIMGPCTTRYNKDSKELEVKIILEYFRAELPNGVLEGRMEDSFVGALAADGQTWITKWRNYGWLEGSTPPDVNYINTHPQTLIFRKLDLKKLKASQ